MTELDIVAHINALAHEEERLYAAGAGEGGLNAEEMARLEEIKVDLDRSYDLLHQRQARIAAGLNPDEAEIRPAEIVEGYEQ
jgi:Protein of unknown function (DUF2630)